MVNDQKSWLKKILKDSWVVNGAIGATSRAQKNSDALPWSFFFFGSVSRNPPEMWMIFRKNIGFSSSIYPTLGFPHLCKRLPGGKSYARKPLLPTRDNSSCTIAFPIMSMREKKTWVNPIFWCHSCSMWHPFHINKKNMSRRKCVEMQNVHIFSHE